MDSRRLISAHMKSPLMAGFFVPKNRQGALCGYVIKNAHNHIRRRDKAADYVGDGIYLQLAVHDYAAGFARSQFYVDKDGRQVWTGATRTAGEGGAARFLANKAEDSLPAFKFELTNNHAIIGRFGTALDIGNDVGYTRATVKSLSGQTNGMMLDTTAGPLTLNAAGGTSYIQLGVRPRWTAGNTCTTVGAAGAAAALPATSSEYIEIELSNGTRRRVAVYSIV